MSAMLSKPDLLVQWEFAPLRPRRAAEGVRKGIAQLWREFARVAGLRTVAVPPRPGGASRAGRPKALVTLRVVDGVVRKPEIRAFLGSDSMLGSRRILSFSLINVAAEEPAPAGEEANA